MENLDKAICGLLCADFRSKEEKRWATEEASWKGKIEIKQSAIIASLPGRGEVLRAEMAVLVASYKEAEDEHRNRDEAIIAKYQR